MKRLLTILLLLLPALCHAQQQNFPGGITSVSSLPATCTPGVTAPVVLTTPPYGIYTCTATNTWSSTANSVGVNSIFAADYGVLGGGKFATDAGITNGSGNVVLSANDPPAVTADIGTPCFATDWTGSDPVYSAFTLRMAQGTIDTVTDAQHFHCTTNSNATLTGTAGWSGADYSTQWANAVNAAYNTYPCKNLVMPAGVSWTTTGFGNSATCTTNTPTAGDKTASASGQGFRTTIIGMLPNFNFSHSTSCNSAGLAGFTGCFFSLPGGFYGKEFSIYGFGFNNTAAVASTALITVGTDSYFWNVDMEQIGASDSNLTGWVLGGAGQLYYNINENGAGGTGVQIVGASEQTTYASFFSSNKNNTVTVNSGSTWVDYHSGFGLNGCSAAQLTNNGTVKLYGTVSFNTCGVGTQGTMFAGASSLFYLDGFKAFTTANSQTTLNLVSGAVAHAIHSNFGNIGGTGQSIFIPTGAKYFDEGGNCPGDQAGCSLANGSQTTGVVSPIYVGNQAVQGACTGVATASSTLGLYGTGPNETLTTCTSTTVGSGIVMTKPGNLSELYVTTTAAGVNASSGAVTVLKNGAGTTVTCTVGTATACIDVTHTVAFVAGDLISIQFTTQAAETLAGVKAIVAAQ